MRRAIVIMFGVLALLATLPAARAADVSGKWLFVMDTEGGERQITAEFHVEGEKVTGKWDASDVAGTFKDGTLDLSFPVTPQETGEKGTLVIKGRLDGEALTGTWQFGEYNGPYKATRKQ